MTLVAHKLSVLSRRNLPPPLKDLVFNILITCVNFTHFLKIITSIQSEFENFDQIIVNNVELNFGMKIAKRWCAR